MLYKNKPKLQKAQANILQLKGHFLGNIKTIIPF